MTVLIIIAGRVAVDAADPRPVCNRTPGRRAGRKITEALEYGKRP